MNSDKMQYSQVISKHQRNYGLDFLRIFLAVMIFLFHSQIHIKCDYGIFNNFVSVGNLVMTGFYILSGYALFLTYHNKDFKDSSTLFLFYKKRFVSSYPLYIITGTLFVVMMTIVGKQTFRDNILLVPIELLGLQCIFPHSLFAFSHNSGTWFMSCIFLCYFLFPYIKELLGGGTFIECFMILLLFVFLWWYIPFISNTFSEGSMYTNPFHRLLEFVIGFLLGRLFMSNGFKVIKKYVALRVFLLLMGSALMIIGVSLCVSHNKDFSLIVIVSFLSFFSALGNSKPSPVKKNMETLLYLSKLTYSFFLSQFFVWIPMKEFLWFYPNINNIARIAISFTVCLLVSVVLHTIIEQKVGKMLNQLLHIV